MNKRSSLQEENMQIANKGTSLVAQWVGVLLLMRETRVRSLFWEDSTYRAATKPVCHNYWAQALEPMCLNDWSPHALGSASHDWWAPATTEACETKSPCSATRESTARRSPHCSGSSVHSTRRESAGTATKTQHNQKLSYLLKKEK